MTSSPCSSCPDRATCKLASPEDCPRLAEVIEPPIDAELQAPFRQEIPSKALTETGWTDPGYRKESNHKRAAAPETDDEVRICRGISRELERGLKHLVEGLPKRRKAYIEAWMRLADETNPVPYQAIADEFGVKRQTVRPAIMKALKSLREAACDTLPKHLTKDKKTGMPRPKRSNAGRKSKIPWDKMELEFMRGAGRGVTSKTLAIKFKVDESTIRSRMSKYNWNRNRTEIEQKITQEAMQNIVRAKSSEVEEIDKTFMKDFKAVRNAIIQELAAFDDDGRMVGVNPNLEAKDLKTLGSALLDCQRGLYLIIGKPSDIQERRVSVDTDAGHGRIVEFLGTVLTKEDKKQLEAKYDRMVQAIDVTPE